MKPYSNSHRAGIGFLLSLLCLGSMTLDAHPSWGIAYHPDGYLVFADVLHRDGTIWRLELNGDLSPILTGEHSHSLFLDQTGTIWGTDHDYLSASEENENALWYWQPDHGKTVVIGPTRDPAQFGGTHFVIRDQNQVIFPYEGKLYQRGWNTEPHLLTGQEFGRVMSLALAESGHVWVVSNTVEGGSLWRVDERGVAERMAANLLDPAPPDPPFSEPHLNMLMGCWVSQDTCLVTNVGLRAVQQLVGDASPTFMYESESPWFPVGITRHEGKTFVMEAGFVSGLGNLGPRILHATKKGGWEVIKDLTEPPLEREAVPPDLTGQPAGSVTYLGWMMAVLLVAGALAGVFHWRRRYSRPGSKTDQRKS